MLKKLNNIIKRFSEFLTQLIRKIRGVKPSIEKKIDYSRILDGEFNRYTSFIFKIKVWQKKELKCWDIHNKHNYYVPGINVVKYFWDDIKRINKKYNNGIKYKRDMELYDKLDYWESSKEIYSMTENDCDGIAIAKWAELKRLGVPDSCNGLCLCRGHMFNCIYEYPDSKNFYVLDNGYLTFRIVKASVLFPIKRKNHMLKPIYGFNMFEIWRYEII